MASVTGVTGYLESSGLGFDRMDVSHDRNEELASALESREGTPGQNLLGYKSRKGRGVFFLAADDAKTAQKTIKHTKTHLW